MTRRLRATTLAAIVVVFLLGTTSTALAHGKIIDSEPARGESVPTAPDELRIWISEPISSSLSTVELQTVDGRVIATGAVHVGTDRGFGLLTVDLPPLEDGTYSAAWTVLSGSDGHITRGLVVFGVGDGTVDTAAFDPPIEDLPIGQGASRWVSLVSLLFVAGACLTAHLTLNGARGIAGCRPVLRWIAAWSGVGILAGVACVVVQAADVTSGSGTGGVSGVVRAAFDLATETTWGRLWIVHQVLLLVILAMSAIAVRRPEPKIGTGLLAGAASLVVVQALASHAAGEGALAVTVDALHLAAASTWVGGLATMLLLRRRHRPAWGRFSTQAVWSVAILTATGLYSTGLHVASADAAIDTSYGRMMLLKLGLVVGIAVFGLVNATLVRPGLLAPVARVLRRAPGWTPVDRNRLHRIAAIELSVGVAAVAMTGLLTSLSPASGVEFAPSEQTIGSQSEVVDDVAITLNAQPNLPGDNVLLVHAASRIRPAKTPIDRVLVRFAYSDDDLGRETQQLDEVEPGRFRLGGSQLGRAGTWNLQVVVRRAGLPDAVADFEWVVPRRGAHAPRISDAPLGPPLTTAAAAILAMVVAAAAWLWFAARPRPPRRRSPRVDSANRTDGHRATTLFEAVDGLATETSHPSTGDAAAGSEPPSTTRELEGANP